MPGGTVWLVGMMGAGKSTVGPALARRLACRFVDSDAAVEHECGRPISEIFASDGEAAFRALERRTLEALAGQRAVVALGGGAIAQPGAAERLAASGTVVYLRAGPEALLARLGDCAERPLLAGTGPAERLARLRELLAEREPAYATASIAVDTDGRSPESVADEVARRLADAAGAAP